MPKVVDSTIVFCSVPMPFIALSNKAGGHAQLDEAVRAFGSEKGFMVVVVFAAVAGSTEPRHIVPIPIGASGSTMSAAMVAQLRDGPTGLPQALASDKLFEQQGWTGAGFEVAELSGTAPLQVFSPQRLNAILGNITYDK